MLKAHLTRIWRRGACGSIAFPFLHASDTSSSYLDSISLGIVSIPTSNLYSAKTAALDPLTILEVLHKRRHRLRAQAWLEMDPEFRHGGKRTWSPAMAGKEPRAQSRLGFHLTLFPLSGVQSHGNGT